MVNVELSDDNNNNHNKIINNPHKNDNENYNDKGKSLDEDIISSNKMEINEKPFRTNNNSIQKKDDDISSVDTK